MLKEYKFNSKSKKIVTYHKTVCQQFSKNILTEHLITLLMNSSSERDKVKRIANNIFNYSDYTFLRNFFLHELFVNPKHLEDIKQIVQQRPNLKRKIKPVDIFAHILLYELAKYVTYGHKNPNKKDNCKNCKRILRDSPVEKLRSLAAKISYIDEEEAMIAIRKNIGNLKIELSEMGHGNKKEVDVYKTKVYRMMDATKEHNPTRAFGESGQIGYGGYLWRHKNAFKRNENDEVFNLKPDVVTFEDARETLKEVLDEMV